MVGNILYYVSVILFAGLIFGKVVTYLKLPHITGYLIGGIIIGPSVLNLVPHEAALSLKIITEAALGFIAFSIGSEFKISQIKKSGKGVMIITVFEALVAIACVDLAMIFIFKQPVQFSIIIGAIAAATAPAATVMVIRQYKAKGPLVDTLLQVVAMDDAVGIIAFSISLAIAQVLSGGGTGNVLAHALWTPSKEIFGAAILGVACGTALSYFSKKATGEEQLLTMTLGALLFTVGISVQFGFSSLIACMMVGATVVNLVNNKRTFTVVDRFTPPIFLAFFTIAGVDVNFGVLKGVGLIGVGYVIFRVVGKLLGAYAGARLTNAPEVVQKYLGFTLIPQAGVAIGLSMVAERVLPGETGLAIKTIILGATVIYELVGPVIAKMALVKAGAIVLEEKAYETEVA
ncbi:MAG TPA: cation:proton antiporter [Clostridiaceae bacterium]|nr:cation:proton antiporter [Clostridiaceae bacterium]